MGTVSRMKRLEKYYKIFEQVYGCPLVSIYDIAQNTGISRNTVSKYVEEMYAQGIIYGPYLRMRPNVTYKEYVYLMNFSDPWLAFNGLKGFPHVLYHAMTFGDWNTMVITDRLLDFSNLVGFETMVKQSIRYCSSTSKPGFKTWDESFKEVYEQVEHVTPVPEYRNRSLTSLDWGPDEWTLFYRFNFMRRTITTTLREIKVGYEVYAKWMKTLDNYCTVHTGFYPEGYQNYLCYCLLVSTDYETSVKSLFSLFPVTSFIMELKKQLLIFTHVYSPTVKSALFCLLYDMETIQLIKKCDKAVVLFHSPYIPQR
jgi:DNA-binding Lrp family transcriptional regulator